MSSKKQESFFEKDHLGTFGGQIKLVPNHGLMETINYAIIAYGHLIERNERVSPQEYATRIRKSYDCAGNLQNAAVVESLGHLL